MLRSILLPFLLAVSLAACAQEKEDISRDEVRRIESVLASDDMKGRRVGTTDIDRAAAFIADEFKKAGLKPFRGGDYLQSFSLLRPKLVSLNFEADGREADTKNLIVITSRPELKVNRRSGYQVQKINRGESLIRRARELIQSGKNVIALVDTAFAPGFSRLQNLKRQIFRADNSVIFILGEELPRKFSIKAEHTFTETRLSNVVGVLPGKARKNEYVVFSGHYDHLGIARQPQNGDSIYNGANDDAAGTTAVITLARYFKNAANNERSLLFAAFTAEEVGEYGSQYFSTQVDPGSVAAMFNIEMIGTESKWGTNSAYITGYDKTTMGLILQNNLKGSGFHFYPDPYPGQNLFYRSDNASLAEAGVPAHTISTSKMDNEPHYHQLSDEVSTLDLANMTAIIRAIAISSASIISGRDTPTRVLPDSLH